MYNASGERKIDGFVMLGSKTTVFLEPHHACPYFTYTRGGSLSTIFELGLQPAEFHGTTA
jgi:hypothetical protein